MTDENEDADCPSYLRKRTEIEEEIRNRQAKWRLKHRAEEIKSARSGKQQKREGDRQPAGEALPGDPEPDERPPATHYKTGK